MEALSAGAGAGPGAGTVWGEARRIAEYSAEHLLAAEERHTRERAELQREAGLNRLFRMDREACVQGDQRLTPYPCRERGEIEGFVPPFTGEQRRGEAQQEPAARAARAASASTAAPMAQWYERECEEALQKLRVQTAEQTAERGDGSCEIVGLQSTVALVTGAMLAEERFAEQVRGTLTALQHTHCASRSR